MPRGLAKVRYEQEAWRWSQGYINQLKMQGIQHIKQLLPVSKGDMLLRTVQMPPYLLEKTLELMRDLKALGTLPVGIPQDVMIRQNRDIQEGRGTVRQAIRAGLTLAQSSDQGDDGYDGVRGSGDMHYNHSGNGRGNSRGTGGSSHPGSPIQSMHPLQLPPLPQPTIQPVDNIDENEPVEMLIGDTPFISSIH